MLSPSYGHIKPTEVHFQSNPQSHSSCQIYCVTAHIHCPEPEETAALLAGMTVSDKQAEPEEKPKKKFASKMRSIVSAVKTAQRLEVSRLCAKQ